MPLTQRHSLPSQTFALRLALKRQRSREADPQRAYDLFLVHTLGAAALPTRPAAPPLALPPKTSYRSPWDRGVEAIVICCEGFTEVKYFTYLLKRFPDERRPPVYILPRLSQSKSMGQHEHLIGNTLLERGRLSKQYGIAEESIESWAVCDDDDLDEPFEELFHYAAYRQVRLAFSRPCFELYLNMHFEDRLFDQKGDLYNAIDRHRRAYGFQGKHTKNKAKLKWLFRAIDEDPERIRTAILNASRSCNPLSTSFSTVYLLVSSLIAGVCPEWGLKP